jgi:hypothetical protein
VFSRKNTAIASRPRLDIWIKGTKIEKVRKHKILGLIFDTRMNWNEHILSTKAKAEKNEHHQMPTPNGGPIKETLRYGEEAYGSASKAVLKKLEPTHNRGIRLALGVLAVCRTENALCKAGVSKLADMRNLNTAITAIRFISNPYHPIRSFFLNPIKLDEYALRPAAPKPLFVRAMEYLGKLQIDTIEKSNTSHSTSDRHGQTSTIRDSIMNFVQSVEVQATIDSKMKRILNEKYEHHSTIYTEERKKTKRSDTQ